MEHIKIRGAREHNLKNINIDIPRNKLVVITGVSGSGKSSLAFDTIYAEGQRRYIESLSAYARQFLEMQKKPDVDSIEGLSPAISIEQKTTNRNPRSTVGTITEIYDYMRLLWARIGVPYSPETGLPIESQTVSNMVDKIMEQQPGSKWYMLAPVIRGKKGTHKTELENLQKQGFTRVRVDGEFWETDAVPDLNKNRNHTIEVVVDRIVIRDGIEVRLANSTETALKIANGIMIIENADTKEQIIFSENFACPISGFSIEEIEPRLFSFNAPMGACPNCSGLGFEVQYSPSLIIPDETKTIRRGAIAPWSRDDVITQNHYLIESVCRHYNISMDKPWKDLKEKEKNIILYGSQGEEIKVNWNGWVVKKPYEGVIPNLERRWKETESDWQRFELEKYQENIPCDLCKGKRLNEKALCIKIDGKDIIDATALSISEALDWFKQISNKLSPKNKEIAQPILKEIIDRLSFLLDVGLNYLTLSRSSGTLSGGESQRIRLASQIGTGLTGVLYVLDEPSIGLHQRDNDKLIDTLKKLRDKSNSVLVVEHDEDIMRASDWLIDIGEGAGIYGGNLIAEGTPKQVMENTKSLTAKYLNGELKIDVPKKRRKGNGNTIELKGVSHHNLKNVDISIPLGTFTCITGVSGSGKSSLILDTLYPLCKKELHESSIPAGKCKSITGINNIDKVIDIDQSPIGRTPRSNPATYIGVFDLIRDWFSKLPTSKERGYKPGRFSFNVKGGRCEACNGDGVIKIDMQFLADVYVECDECHGTRYNRETLQVEYKGKNIADILNMSVDEAIRFFENIPSIKDKLLLLSQVGLGYIKLGQSATTLSGGEAQRVKLSKELSKRATGRTLYILDEPTTGLHFHDVKKLLEVLHKLVDQGNTVIVIEHNLEVIKTADYIYDLGPEGGDGGGEIIAHGTPEEIIKSQKSYTAKYLKKYI